MGISFSNIGTVGREQLITSGSNGEPNWSYIPSKGKSTRTQTEFVSEIKKLAQKAANATDKTEQDAISRQLLQLRAEYLSEVAPDRKQLYQQVKSAMKNQNANPKCKGIGELTLLDFLEQAEGKNQNLADKQIALAGGGTLNFTILTSGGYGVQIQSQGVNVLLNTGAGWGYEMTPADRGDVPGSYRAAGGESIYRRGCRDCQRYGWNCICAGCGRICLSDSKRCNNEKRLFHLYVYGKKKHSYLSCKM